MDQNEANEMLIEAVTVEEAKLALKNGADVNGFVQDSPVVENSIRSWNDESLELLEFLLKSGANVNMAYRDFDDTTTPFLSLFASRCGRHFSELDNEKIKLMIQYGADLDKEFVHDDYECPYSHNALEFAVISESLETVKILAAAGADVNKVDYKLLEWCKDKSICEYIENCRKSKVILENKQAYKKDQIQSKRQKKQISGVVVADIIADKIREGKEKRVITREVGKELRQDIMKERYSKKR